MRLVAAQVAKFAAAGVTLDWIGDTSDWSSKRLEAMAIQLGVALRELRG